MRDCSMRVALARVVSEAMTGCVLAVQVSR